VSRESEGESKKERESLRVSVSAYLVCPASHYVKVFVSTSTCVHVNVCQREREPFSLFLPRKALDIPFYRYKEMPSCTMGCSDVLTWLAEKHLKPCTCANVAVGEVP
jgi:hypothetical protein